MELRQRLTLLRRQSGAPQTTEAPPTFHPPDSVEERLQRLRGASAEGMPRPGRDEPVAVSRVAADRQGNINCACK